MSEQTGIFLTSTVYGVRWFRNPLGFSDPAWAPSFALVLVEEWWTYFDLVGRCWGRPVYRERRTRT